MIKYLEILNIFLIRLMTKLLPKHAVNDRVIVYADLGIGDLIMFMPAIKILLDYNYDLSFYVTRQINKEILRKHFPNCQQYISGKYGWSLQNFHGQHYKSYFKKLLWLRIPNRIGHVRNNYKWNKFFNIGIKMNDNGGYQVEKNLDLIYPFIKKNTSITKSLFFETEQVRGLPERYIVVSPFSWTDPSKKVDLTDIIKNSKFPVIIIGSKEEEIESIEYCKQFNNIINYTGKFNIFQTAYIIKNAQCIYTHEGGLGHLAAAVGAKVKIHYYINHHRCDDIFHRNLNNVKYILVDDENR